MGCPLCGEEFASLAELEAHADSHFSQPTPSSRPAATGLRRCGACGAFVAPEEFASHQLAHKLEEEELAAADSAAASRALTEELDAQGAAQAAAEEWGDGGGGSDDEDALHTAQLEELYFEQLKARYGFAVPQRSGCCRLCGRDGHWAADCEQNPDRKAAAQRVLDPPLPPRIVATQQQGEATRMRGTAGLVQLLAAALEGQQAPPSQEYAAALCGDVQHFGASHFTSGWGCGWNNMQMLASHLLATRAVRGAHQAAAAARVDRCPWHGPQAGRAPAGCESGAVWRSGLCAGHLCAAGLARCGTELVLLRCRRASGGWVHSVIPQRDGSCRRSSVASRVRPSGCRAARWAGAGHKGAGCWGTARGAPAE